MQAIVWLNSKFRHYLVGRKFTIECDQNPLKYLNSFHDTHGKRRRWLDKLMEFDF